MQVNVEEGAMLARAEYAVAAPSVAKDSPHQAVIRFYERLDTAIEQAAAVAVTKLACKSGCSYCCHFKVEASAAEVLAIRTHVVNKFAPADVKRVLDAARRNAEEAKGLSLQEHLATNQACAFLHNGVCSVYAVRPSKCRNFHASNVNDCKYSFDNPHDLASPSSYVPEVFTAANAVSDGFKHASDEAGFDPRVYDLNSAFVEAMAMPSAAKRLATRKRTFLRATVVAHPTDAA